MPTWVWVFNLGINMNIELEEVAVQDVSDDALELAAGGAQGGPGGTNTNFDRTVSFRPNWWQGVGC